MPSVMSSFKYSSVATPRQGHATKLGKSRWKSEYRIGKLVEVQSGPVKKVKKTTHTVTLHGIDVANIRAGRLMLFREEEITSEIRAKVDEQIEELIKSKKAEPVPGGAVHRRGSHARHRGVQLLEQSPRAGVRPTSCAGHQQGRDEGQGHGL
jgi:hypothetical protein